MAASLAGSLPTESEPGRDPGKGLQEPGDPQLEGAVQLHQQLWEPGEDFKVERKRLCQLRVGRLPDHRAEGGSRGGGGDREPLLRPHAETAQTWQDRLYVSTEHASTQAGLQRGSWQIQDRQWEMVQSD